MTHPRARAPRRPDDDGGAVDLLDQYCRDVGRYQVLDAATCAALAEKAQRGSQVARHDLVHANLRLVIPLAKKRMRREPGKFELMDLIQLGNLALMECVDGYRSYASGASFATWARKAVELKLWSPGRGNGSFTVFHGADEREDPDELPEARMEREQVDAQFLATMQSVLSARELFVVTRLAGLGTDDAVWTHKALAAALSVSHDQPRQIRKRAAAKLEPYLSAYAGKRVSAVLSSVSRALRPQEKQLPATTLLGGTKKQRAAGLTANLQPTHPTIPTALLRESRDDTPARDGTPVPVPKRSTEPGRRSNARANPGAKKTA